MTGKLFVAGISNSLMKDGYISGLCHSLAATAEYYGLGGSNLGMGLWANMVFSRELAASEFAIYESWIMDLQTDLEFIPRDMMALRRFFPTGSAAAGRGPLPVILLWPDQITFREPDMPALRLYVESCAAAGLPLIDMRPLITEYALRHGVSYRELYRDEAHIKPEHAQALGMLLARHLRELQRQYARDGLPPPQAEPAHVAIQPLAADNGREIGPPWLKLEVAPLRPFKALRTGLLCGLMLESRRFEYNVRAGESDLLVLHYWEPVTAAPPKPALRYLSFPSLPVVEGEEVDLRAYVDGIEDNDAIELNSALYLLQA